MIAVPNAVNRNGGSQRFDIKTCFPPSGYGGRLLARHTVHRNTRTVSIAIVALTTGLICRVAILNARATPQASREYGGPNFAVFDALMADPPLVVPPDMRLGGFHSFNRSRTYSAYVLQIPPRLHCIYPVGRGGQPASTGARQTTSAPLQRYCGSRN